jgi:hypothetical protein
MKGPDSTSESSSSRVDRLLPIGHMKVGKYRLDFLESSEQVDSTTCYRKQSQQAEPLFALSRAARLL